MRFRKKPVVIDAVQFKYSEWSDPLLFSEYPEWLDAAFEADVIRGVFESEDYWYLQIITLEGAMRAGPDDWIVRGVQGELYPVKPDIFNETYEPAEEEDA